MDSTNESWATDFVVTPAVAHAVEVLRQVIPRDNLPSGAVGVRISIADGNMEHCSAALAFIGANKHHRVNIPLTEQQQTAAHMLISVAAYHHEQMCVMFGEEDSSGKMPNKLAAAQKKLREDIRRKLNIDLEGYFLNELTGSVTVYA